MEKLQYVSDEYQEMLIRLAERLVTPERFAPIGELIILPEVA